MNFFAQRMILGFSLISQISLHAMNDKEYILMRDRRYLINKNAAAQIHEIAAPTLMSGCCILTCVYSAFTFIPSVLACSELSQNNLHHESLNCCAATALISGSALAASSKYLYKDVMDRQEKITNIMVREGAWEDDKCK